MGILTFDMTCPHCLRENAVLEAWAEIRNKLEPVVNVAFACRSCSNSGIAVVLMKNPGSYLPKQRASMNKDIDVIIPGSPDYELLAAYPKPISVNAPENTPPRVASNFIEAKENLSRGRYDTSVMLCRKVLDIATRALLEDNSTTETLVKRISKLHGKGLITDQMKDWAHIVRIDSNAAVHSDEEFSREECEEMIGFTEVFLIYAFSLPAMVLSKKHDQEQ